MAKVLQLLGERTHGYSEKREASFDENGTLRALLIDVTWDDGTKKNLFIELAGPPTYTFTQSGSLDYPDGSRMRVVVPPDGTLRLVHSVYWQSPNEPHDYEDATTTTTYRSDGSGSREFSVEGERSGAEFTKMYYYDFDSGGRHSSEVRSYTFSTDLATGTRTDTIESVTLEGVRTVQTIIHDVQGNLISDTTVVTHVNPLVEPDRNQRVEPEPRGGRQVPRDTSAPPVWGPRETPEATGGGHYPDGFQALPRLVGPDPVGELAQCEEWEDYYLRDEGTGEVHYLGSRFRGVGPCY